MVASAYRPGGAIDLVVALACFSPVLVADAGVVWPPLARSHRGRVALVWIWVAAMLLAIPVLYGIARTIALDGRRACCHRRGDLRGGLALGAMAFFSIVGLVHKRRGETVFEQRSTWLAAGLSLLLSAALGLAFVFVALANDQALRDREPTSSRFGPTDPDLVPPFCDEPLRLGQNAVVTIEARSSVDTEDRGSAVLTGNEGAATRAGEDRGPGRTERGSWPTCASAPWDGSTTAATTRPRRVPPGAAYDLIPSRCSVWVSSRWTARHVRSPACRVVRSWLRTWAS